MTNITAFKRMKARRQKQKKSFDICTDASGNTIKVKISEALEREQAKLVKELVKEFGGKIE